MLIYHITTRQEWSSQKTNGFYTPTGYAKDGFIHCSTAAQVWTVANRFYFDQPDLVVLEIDTAALDSQVVFENLEGGSENFPHIYSKLPVSAVLKAVSFSIAPFSE